MSIKREMIQRTADLLRRFHPDTPIVVPEATMKLTEKRERILQQAARHHLGLATNPYIVGFERVAWDKNASWLCENGLLARYVHGGFEITDAGRAALKSSGGDHG